MSSTATPQDEPTLSVDLKNPQMFMVVQRQDGMVIGFSREEFEAMPQTTITAAGEKRTGVTLKEIMFNCEIAGFQFVIVRGEPPLSINSKDLTERTIIYIDEAGILRFASEDISPLKWPDRVQYMLVR